MTRADGSEKRLILGFRPDQLLPADLEQIDIGVQWSANFAGRRAGRTTGTDPNGVKPTKSRQTWDLR
jgi:hypothetical protein